MRRLALVTALTMLSLPGTAGAATFSARVVRVSAGALTVRLGSDRIVRFVGPRAASAPAHSVALGHAAREAAPAAVALDLRALDPGVTVVVSTGSAAGALIALPGPGAPGQRARGVVSAVEPDGFVLQLPDRTSLRLHSHARVRACETAAVSYHQDAGLLLVDSFRGGRLVRRTARCAARTAAGTITAISARGLTIRAGADRSLTLSASAATIAGFAVGDVVDVSYAGGRARQLEYVQQVARGTVTASGSGALTIADSATGLPVRLSASAHPAPGEHVVVVYHRAAVGAVADVLYAQAA